MFKKLVNKANPNTQQANLAIVAAAMLIMRRAAIYDYGHIRRIISDVPSFIGLLQIAIDVKKVIMVP